MNFDNLVKGVQRRALKITIMGTPGVGKTTFAAAAPDVVFADLEKGSNNLDVTRFDNIGAWQDLLDTVAFLYKEDHPYKTFALDSMSVAERLASEKIARAANVTAVEEIPYGKGAGMVKSEIEQLLRGLDMLVAKGMNVILVCHSIVTRFDDPAGDSYDMYDVALSKRVAPLVKQWADTLLFADHEKVINKDGAGFNERKVAKSFGRRIMHTSHRASHEAKNRFNLPDVMPLSWPDFEAAVEAFYTPTTEQEETSNAA